MFNINFNEVKDAFLETFLMTITTSVIVFVLGLILGYLLYFTKEKNKTVHKLLDIFTSVVRSIPFIILIILMLPLTNALFNLLFGSNQRLLFSWQVAVPALVISATPFYARLVYNSLNEIDSGTKEMLISFGASNKEIRKIMFSEAMPSLIAGFTTTVVTLIGFTSMAAIIGAGGLGDLAARERNKTVVVLIATILILLLVFIVQYIGDLIVKKIDKR